MARPIHRLEATEEEALELNHLARGSKVSVRDRFRAGIVLLRLEGKSETEVARALGCSLGAVCKWSKRFDSEGMAGLKDAPGRGRKAGVVFGDFDWETAQPAEKPKFLPQMSPLRDNGVADSDKMAPA
jgi:hypothetical protein